MGSAAAISETFATHGARVVVAEINPERAEETVAAIAPRAETRSARSWTSATRAAVTDLVAAVGTVDVLVNNVGHYLPGDGDFLTSTPDEWRALYRVNLEHVFLCTRAFVPGMVARRRGSVINVSSVEAFRAIPRRPVYSAFKGAITQFTKSLAVELGNDGVRVNAIAPGPHRDDPGAVLALGARRSRRSSSRTWVPVGRFGTPDDIAGVALFLASDLSAFVTGTTIHADGGSLAAGGWFRRPDGTWTNRPVKP